MNILLVFLLYLIFLLSGAAALLYQVLWVRYLSLVFGGSHLAVTTVLAVFMGGLALGGYLFGRRAGNCRKLFRLYGLLELGIAFFALIFVGLLKFYPSVYLPLARAAGDSPLSLSLIRVGFAVIALIGPTTLMGGTLPVLSALVSRRISGLGRHLSFLYAVNTFGAVLGAGLAGFVFLRYYTAGTTLAVAFATNVAIGIAGIVLQDKMQAALEHAEEEKPAMPAAESDGEPGDSLPLRLVLWGIGISGFCALGYEILWTRLLSIVIGASVYGFTIMLMAFLCGIALGSTAYGIAFSGRGSGAGRVAGFGVVQVVIGLTALAVTMYIRELPSHAHALLQHFQVNGFFGARQWSSLVLAFSYMFVPAFFMGAAFPLAGAIHGSSRRSVGRSVGDVLAYNTLGAILGSALTGFVLIYLVGIQGSLQILALVNIGFGVVVAASVFNKRGVTLGVAAASAAAIATVACHPALPGMWNPKLLAIYQANRPDKFSTPQKTREALANYDVLFYGEGAQAIVSSIRSKDGVQSFLTNGRVEATDNPGDIQCQYTLGHLPMLLCKNPKKVFVLGTGSGMTLGATSVHPGVEKITLAEIEPKVLGVAKTFARYNHNVLSNPKLRIVLNDGRNFLMTSGEKFDVITADPIHPWFSGAGYLYSTEYFRLAASHLNPGGVICQWLPIYELTDENLKSVVATFRRNFKYTMLWLTYVDAELVGSNSPFDLDEERLQRRISEPEIAKDLQRVGMGSARALLSYFVMGDQGMNAFASGGIVNTDDNLYLEFSAPLSIGDTALLGRNYYNLSRNRELILPYLRRPADLSAQEEQRRYWERAFASAPAVDEAHALQLAGGIGYDDYRKAIVALDASSADYAPWQFLREEFSLRLSQAPTLYRQSEPMLVGEGMGMVEDRISAVVRRISREMALVEFSSDGFRVPVGHLQVLGAERERRLARLVDDTMQAITATYDAETRKARARGESAPQAVALLPAIKELINARSERAN